MKEYKTLKDHVYEYISEMINNGTLSPNEKINEKEISNKLDISRTPVREALIQLVNEGYLEKKPRRGFIVKEINEKTVKEVYQIIGILEGLAANLAINNLDEEDFKEMNKLVEKMDIAIKYEDYREYYELQTNFHKIYIKDSGNKKLGEILESLKKLFIKKTYYHEEDNDSMIKKALKETNEEHKEIINLFQEKDMEEIKNYLKDVHWNNKYAKLDSFEKKSK